MTKTEFVEFDNDKFCQSCGEYCAEPAAEMDGGPICATCVNATGRELEEKTSSPRTPAPTARNEKGETINEASGSLVECDNCGECEQELATLTENNTGRRVHVLCGSCANDAIGESIVIGGEWTKADDVDPLVIIARTLRIALADKTIRESTAALIRTALADVEGMT